MEKVLSKCIEKLIEENSVEALYLYGSYVNGYYMKDSDIDVVALTSTPTQTKTFSIPPNISVHLINPIILSVYESGLPYTHLRMVPIHNKKECQNVSDKLKSELVRRELIRFRKAGINEFDVLDPLKNYLLGYGIQRPWRIKQIKRIFASEEAQRILGEEYQRIFNILEEKEMVKRRNGKYALNEGFVFDEEIEQLRDEFLFKVRNSVGGWHYLINFRSMIDFSRRRV